MLSLNHVSKSPTLPANSELSSSYLSGRSQTFTLMMNSVSVVEGKGHTHLGVCIGWSAMIVKSLVEGKSLYCVLQTKKVKVASV